MPALSKKGIKEVAEEERDCERKGEIPGVVVYKWIFRVTWKPLLRYSKLDISFLSKSEQLSMACVNPDICHVDAAWNDSG